MLQVKDNWLGMKEKCCLRKKEKYENIITHATINYTPFIQQIKGGDSHTRTSKFISSYYQSIYPPSSLTVIHTHLPTIECTLNITNLKNCKEVRSQMS